MIGRKLQFRSEGEVLVDIFRDKVLISNGVDPNNLKASALELIRKLQDEIRRLKQPPLKVNQLIDELVNHEGMGRKFGKKQKIFLNTLAKTFPNTVRRDCLLKKIQIKGGNKEQQRANLRGFVRDLRIKFRVFKISDLVQIMPSRSKKHPGYRLQLQSHN